MHLRNFSKNFAEIDAILAVKIFADPLRCKMTPTVYCMF